MTTFGHHTICCINITLNASLSLKRPDPGRMEGGADSLSSFLTLSCVVSMIPRWSLLLKFSRKVTSGVPDPVKIVTTNCFKPTTAICFKVALGNWRTECDSGWLSKYSHALERLELHWELHWNHLVILL